MDFLTTILAQLFEKFKAGNPKVAALVLLALFTLVEAAHRGALLGLFPDNATLAEAVRLVGAFLLAVTGSRTVQFLPGQLRSEREALYASAVNLPKPVVQDNRDKADDTLTRWLAWLFDRFKAANPKAAAWILLFLFVAMEAAHRGVLLKVFDLPAWADEVLFVVSGLLAALTTARTVQFLPFAQRREREEEYKSATAA